MGLSRSGVLALSGIVTILIGTSSAACSSAGSTAAVSAALRTATPKPTVDATPWPSVVSLPTQLQASPAYGQLLPLFDYQGDRPFDVTHVGADTANGGVTIEDITFVGAAGETVEAYLVLPPGDGPFPGVLFEHGFGEIRDTFLGEAETIAKDLHVAGLLVTRPTSAVTADNVTETILQVREMRRALDLLQSLPAVDASRVAYVGFSQGGVYGVVLAAVDKRLETAVFMSAPPTSFNLPTDVFAQFAPEVASGSAMFQFGRSDSFYTEADANAFGALVTVPKKIAWYDGGHGLNYQALEDRDAWLADKLAAR